MDYNIKRLSDYSDDRLLNEIKRVAIELDKDTLTIREFDLRSRVHSATIVKRFGFWSAALKKAGLSVNIHRNPSSEELFGEIEKVWNRLGRQPKSEEMKQFGKFSLKPYQTRFGGWIKALEEFSKWKKKEQEYNTKDLEETLLDTFPDQPRKKLVSKRVEYGEPIEFRGLRYAPLNEQGVVYLFGMLSKQLGFIIEVVRNDFPDCEGKRQKANTRQAGQMGAGFD